MVARFAALLLLVAGCGGDAPEKSIEELRAECREREGYAFVDLGNGDHHCGRACPGLGECDDDCEMCTRFAPFGMDPATEDPAKLVEACGMPANEELAREHLPASCFD